MVCDFLTLPEFTEVENGAICFQVVVLRFGEGVEFVMIILLNGVKEFQPTAVCRGGVLLE